MSLDAAPRHPLAWLPNALTMARVALAPAILASLLVPALEHPGDPAVLAGRTGLAAALLVVAAIFDWADGRLARTLQAESAFGRFWDPVADKLVVGAALVGAGFAMPTLWVIVPAAALISRDLAITWLRRQPRYAAAVASPSRLAKWKTAVEYGALILLFGVAPASALMPPTPSFILVIAPMVLIAAAIFALWLAAALSLWTGWDYFRTALRRPSP